MSYEFPPDLGQRVESLLGWGYEDVNDVLRHALSALERERQEVVAIQDGIEDMEKGRFRSLDDADAEIRRRYSFPPIG